MINKKAATAAGIGALFAITMFVCSCYAGRNNPAAIYDDTANSDVNGGESAASSAEANSTAESSLPDTSTGSASNSYDSPNGSAAQEVQPQTPKFDDPESYLTYDPEADDYILTSEEEKLAGESLFVGDSICFGFSAWGVIPGRNVYATGSVAARNLFDFEMYYLNEPAEFVPVLNEVQPEHVFLWMGMNDVNMTSSEEYCENYNKIISTALDNSSADVYVCAITPIRDPYFTEPGRILEFNDAIEHYIKVNFDERVRFISFGEPLKDSDGVLDEQNDGGDGIHLSKRAYYIAMHEITKQINN